MKRTKKPKPLAGPPSGDEGTSELWETRVGIIKMFICFATIVTCLRVGKSAHNVAYFNDVCYF